VHEHEQSHNRSRDEKNQRGDVGEMDVGEMNETDERRDVMNPGGHAAADAASELGPPPASSADEDADGGGDGGIQGDPAAADPAGTGGGSNLAAPVSASGQAGAPAAGDADDAGGTHDPDERSSGALSSETPEAAAPQSSVARQADAADAEAHADRVSGAPDESVTMAPDYVTEETFESMGLPAVLLEAVQARGYTRPTPVQVAAYAPAVAGKDLIVRSKTGTGKTAAFMLPVLTRVPAGDRRPRAIVLAPTRELAIQVADEGIALAQYKDVSVVPIYGGVGLGTQVEQLKKGAEIVVGTPGRILDHIRRGHLDLSEAMVAVLDEADEMLSMGFLEEVRTILRHLPEESQTLLFSATVDASVSGLVRQFMREPQEIMLSTDVRTVEHIRNILYDCVPDIPKARSLLYLLHLEAPESAIIFCNTRDDCAFVTGYLKKQGFDAEYINSDLAQRDRERVMNKIKRGELSFLVATDIAARGIDISDLTHVINYSLPEDPDLYLHRVGRTGRIGKLGTAISLTSGGDLTAELALQNRLKIPFERRRFPSVEEIDRAFGERQLALLRKAAGTVAYESFLPLARSLQTAVDEPERDRLLATALRIFFTWGRTSPLFNPNVAASSADEREEQGARAPDRGRGRRRGERSDGRREGRSGERNGGRRERSGGRSSSRSRSNGERGASRGGERDDRSRSRSRTASGNGRSTQAAEPSVAADPLAEFARANNLDLNQFIETEGRSGPSSSEGGRGEGSRRRRRRRGGSGRRRSSSNGNGKRSEGGRTSSEGAEKSG